VGAVPHAVSRRQFLKGAGATGAGLMLGGRFAHARIGASAPHVIIVGAGFSGLSCAFKLHNAGARVTVLEARNRVGGRVLSLKDFIEGRVVEGGAELIGSNHPTWMTYAQHFGLEFRDVSEPESDKTPIVLNDVTYSGPDLKALWERIDDALSLLNADARKVNLERPWETPGAVELDNTSLASAFGIWDLDETARHGALTLLSNDDVLWPDRASYLACLSCVAGGGYEKFWTESEVFRCIGGNQQMAFKLAGAVGEENIRLSAPVTRIRLGGTGSAVDMADGTTVEGDIVVLTVPPSAWNNFTIDPGLPQGYQPSTGPAVKYLSKVSGPFWEKSGLMPGSLTDTPVGETWEGTDGQGQHADDPACLTVFSGGQAAQDCLDFAPGERDQKLQDQLEAIYPGYASAVSKTLFVSWPTDKWTQCGYCSPRLGEVTSIYANLDRGFEDRLFFAGEYTSLLFTGFMEGGLSSGAKLANKLAASFSLSVE